jgi:hypothetical protein
MVKSIKIFEDKTSSFIWFINLDDRKLLFRALWIAGVVGAVKDSLIPISWGIKTRTTTWCSTVMVPAFVPPGIGTKWAVTV